MLLRNDTLWKSIIEELIEDFLKFFYANADEIINFKRGFEFLDTELGEIFPDADKDENIQHVDKLVKVWMKNGKSQWILIHIEVQGKAIKNFAVRMFTYFYRIRHRFNCDIAALAIFTDSNKKFRPNEFKVSFLETSLEYKYKTYKIIDQDEESLRLSNNPFASIILTVLLALKKSKLAETKILDLKFEIFKNLYAKGFSAQKIRVIANFLKNYVRLNENNTRIFESKIKEFTGKTNTMGIEQQLLEQELKKGEDNKTRKFIRNARLIKNFSIELISELVELPPNRVRKILDEMGID